MNICVPLGDTRYVFRIQFKMSFFCIRVAALAFINQNSNFHQSIPLITKQRNALSKNTTTSSQTRENTQSYIPALPNKHKHLQSYKHTETLFFLCLSVSLSLSLSLSLTFSLLFPLFFFSRSQG